MKKIVNKELELRPVRKKDVKILSSIVQALIFRIYLIEGGKKVGLITLRPHLTPELEEYGGHLEYEIDKKFRGNNYAAKGCIMLLPFMKSLGINPVIVTCDPENIASIKTIEKIGGKFISTKNIKIAKGKIRSTNKYHITL